MYQSHRWQEQIKIETITSLKNMLTTWLAKHDKSSANHIFKLGGNVYAFDSTTIDLCLSSLLVGKIPQKKGGIKVHTLYDVETQIPAFFHITEASVHDSKVMIEIPYEPSSYYILTAVITTSKYCIKFIKLKPTLLSEQKESRVQPSNGNVGCPKNVLSDASVF